MKSIHPRRLLVHAALATCLSATAFAAAHAQGGWDSVTLGTFVLFRHALAPGGGDPPGFVLNECSTQRNLSAEGQAQAQRIGAAFRQRNIPVAAVWSSQWCRTRQTADLAFPGKRQDQALFNSFFGAPERGTAQSQAALAWLAAQPTQGVTVVVTHQVNITDLTGIFPASGEGVVVAMRGNAVQVLGRITP